METRLKLTQNSIQILTVGVNEILYFATYFYFHKRNPAHKSIRGLKRQIIWSTIRR